MLDTSSHLYYNVSDFTVADAEGLYVRDEDGSGIVRKRKITITSDIRFAFKQIADKHSWLGSCTFSETQGAHPQRNYSPRTRMCCGSHYWRCRTCEQKGGCRFIVDQPPHRVPDWGIILPLINAHNTFYCELPFRVSLNNLPHRNIIQRQDHITAKRSCRRLPNTFRAINRDA